MMYDRGMKTVVICGDAPLPDGLREVIARGSTEVAEHRAADLGGAPSIEADRIVFWSAAAEPEVLRLAERYARREAGARRDPVMFVSAGDAARADLPFMPDEVFAWPGDEDRLKMAFMTSA
jgi:hypothetical protein